jgi:glycosyltransferase involved in cell wall biosynthesis
MECVDQVRATANLPEYEIIIVDDHSDVPLPEINGAIIIRHDKNKGVGQSFDTGVRHARGENLILMACDMRFIANDWANKLVKVIEDNPKSLICTTCVGLNHENMDFEKRRNVLRCYGATILMFHDKKSNPSKSDTFRGIIEAKWWSKQPGDVYEIPCILGACYGVKKSWYNYIDGWWNHSQWGTLEPYISLKSWMFGGNCLVATHIETAHIFKLEGSPINTGHQIKQDRLMYNKMLVSKLLMPDPERYISFLGRNTIVDRARVMIANDEELINSKRVVYDFKKKMSIEQFAEKFNIDLRLTS